MGHWDHLRREGDLGWWGEKNKREISIIGLTYSALAHKAEVAKLDDAQ